MIYSRLILISTVWTFSSVNGTVHTVCAKTDTGKTSISLNCSSNQMIHVISELYGRRTSEDNCTVVRADSNTKLLDSNKNGLIVNCNGYKQCIEQAACGEHCKGSGNAFEITYECVEDSRNICTSLQQTGPLPSLHLHSPRFPDGPEEEKSCECTVSGQSLNVLMIQNREGITTTGPDNNTWTSNYTLFNRRIVSDAGFIVFDYGNSSNTFWLNISGNITYIACNNSAETKETETTETTISVSSSKMTQTSTEHTNPSICSTADTKTAPSHKTTEAGSTGEESITVITVSAVVGVFIFLLLVIIGLLVYFKVIKPQRQRQKNTPDRVNNNETYNDNISGSNETRNTYSDLVRYANQDNDYGKLHLYANPQFHPEETSE